MVLMLSSTRSHAWFVVGRAQRRRGVDGAVGIVGIPVAPPLLPQVLLKSSQVAQLEPENCSLLGWMKSNILVLTNLRSDWVRASPTRKRPSYDICSRKAPPSGPIPSAFQPPPQPMRWLQICFLRSSVSSPVDGGDVERFSLSVMSGYAARIASNWLARVEWCPSL